MTVVHERELVAQIETLSLRRLRGWVRRGWVHPSAGADGMRFGRVDAARVRLLCELRDDLGLGEDTLPVVLSLIDQVHGLRRELRTLLEAVEAQPEDVRRAIAAHVRRSGGEAGD